MKKSKYCVLFLLTIVICLVSIVVAYAASNDYEWCMSSCTRSGDSGGEEACESYCINKTGGGDTTSSDSEEKSSVTTPEAPKEKEDDVCKKYTYAGCESCTGSAMSEKYCQCYCSGGSSSTSTDEPKVVALPEDSRGAYYIDGGVKKYIQYKTWSECMNDLGDANKCGRLVTDECESCLGVCQTAQAKGTTFSSGSCYSVCRTSCDGRGTGAAYTGKDSSGTDDYGSWYLEGGVKKYSNFNDFRSCWSVMGDAKECIKYGYYCGYKNGFYVSYLCSWDDDACRERVMDEYAAACK